MEIQNLTDEEINRKVAELMGWVWFESHNQHGYWQYPSDRTRDRWSCNMHRFSTSLDACAKFEATIADVRTYTMNLEYVAMEESPDWPRWDAEVRCFKIITATPGQRCIAFLRMKGVL